jgi:hypothetical protein
VLHGRKRSADTRPTFGLPFFICLSYYFCTFSIFYFPFFTFQTTHGRARRESHTRVGAAFRGLVRSAARACVAFFYFTTERGREETLRRGACGATQSAQLRRHGARGTRLGMKSRRPGGGARCVGSGVPRGKKLCAMRIRRGDG